MLIKKLFCAILNKTDHCGSGVVVVVGVMHGLQLMHVKTNPKVTIRHNEDEKDTPK